MQNRFRVFGKLEGFWQEACLLGALAGEKGVHSVCGGGGEQGPLAMAGSENLREACL